MRGEELVVIWGEGVRGDASVTLSNLEGALGAEAVLSVGNVCLSEAAAVSSSPDPTESLAAGVDLCVRKANVRRQQTRSGEGQVLNTSLMDKLII